MGEKRYCSNCGAEMDADQRFCTECGSTVTSQQGMQQSAPVNQGYYYTPRAGYGGTIPDEYKPISAWGYFGYEILFIIPVIGLICLLVFALGGTSNRNLKNFARSYFCIVVILLILALIAMMGMSC